MAKGTSVQKIVCHETRGKAAAAFTKLESHLNPVKGKQTYDMREELRSPCRRIEDFDTRRYGITRRLHYLRFEEALSRR